MISPDCSRTFDRWASLPEYSGFSCAFRAHQAFRPGRWNQCRTRADGPRIRTWLNGIPNAYAAERTTGNLGFQAHGVGERADPLEMAGRRVRIRLLGGRSKQAEGRCLLEGIRLRQQPS